jgi:UDP-glucose 4-epimerase
VKIVITGALGHIGSKLIRTLGVEFPNAEIIMIDNMMTQRYCSLFNLPPRAKYKFIEADVTKTDLSKIFDGAHVIIHLAAITDAAGSFDRASELEANNFIATKRVAEAAVSVHARLMAISSTSVYGTQNDVVSEDCAESELAPQSPYAETKLREERTLSEMVRNNGLKMVICRLGTIYGVSPGMRFHTAVNKFCWQAALGQPITVWKTAYEQKRPYLDLGDAANAMTFLIKKDVFDGRIYNVVTSNITVKEVVEAIQEFVPSVEISFVNNKIMNQLSYEVLSDRLQGLGFRYSGNLRAAISETIEILKNARSEITST